MVGAGRLSLAIGEQRGGPGPIRGGHMYEAPTIVYEGELEVQAGSPGGVPLWDDTALDN